MEASEEKRSSSLGVDLVSIVSWMQTAESAQGKSSPDGGEPVKQPGGTPTLPPPSDDVIAKAMHQSLL